MTRRLILPVWASLALAACASGARPPSPSPSVPIAPPTVPGPGITTDGLRRDLFAFAADSFRGRETGTPDARRAAIFIATRLQSLGVEPAGDSMYMQRVPLMRESFASTTRLLLTDARGGPPIVLRVGDDLVPVTSFGDGVPEPKRNGEGDVVFAGYGLNSPELKRDDLSRIDLAGKVIVVVHGAPAGVSGEQKKHLESQQSLGERLGRLVSFRPAAIIFLMGAGTEDFYGQIMPELLRGVVPAEKQESPSDAARPLPMVLFGLARAGSPLLPAGWPNDTRPQPLARRFSGHVEIRRDRFVAFNVVGVVRGTDARLSHTYVAFGAHYDHVGVVHEDTRAGVMTDSIANGADDDGSGVVSLLAVARQMSVRRGRRSTLFVWHVGEEKGLLGSSYFTEHPTVPIDSIVAQLNADMIGRNAPDLLYVVGPHAAPNDQSRVLGMIVDSVNKALPLPFAFNREWDDPNHPEQIYQRSDHYNYAKKGVPIVFFTSGLHDDYHKVSDEPQKIDFEKLARVTRLLMETGTAVANRSTRPR